MSLIDDNFVQSLLDQKVAKRCPNCLICAEKIDGCSFLDCTFCHAQWCWECERVKNFSPVKKPEALECSNTAHNSHS